MCNDIKYQPVLEHSVKLAVIDSFPERMEAISLTRFYYSQAFGWTHQPSSGDLTKSKEP